MNDVTRNQAYQAILSRAVTPGSVVYKIGAGAGLLALHIRGSIRVAKLESGPLPRGPSAFLTDLRFSARRPLGYHSRMCIAIA